MVWSGKVFRNIRISILLVIFSYLCISAYSDLNPKWDKPVNIVMHPVNIQNDPNVSKYIQSLSQKNFDEISEFISKNASNYANHPVVVNYILGEEVHEAPPLANESIADSPLKTMWWSLKFKFYALINRTKMDGVADSRMYLNYYYNNTSKPTQSLERSTALQRGRIAYVNLWANGDDNGLNNTIIAHESMHTFGAEDYYNPSSGIPIYPTGFADPDKAPLYPQTRAELMAPYILLNEEMFILPKDFSEIIIRETTAKDVGWLIKK